jgi:hypothetical protein
MAASVEGGETVNPRQSLAISQNARLVLTKWGDTELPQEDRFDFRTFGINNRLQPVPTGFTLQIPEIGDAIAWVISDKSSYTILVNLSNVVDQQVAVLRMSTDGELADSGQRLQLPGLANTSFDITPEGGLIVIGGSAGSSTGNPSLFMFEVDDQGDVLLHDYSSDDGGGTMDVAFRHGVPGLVTANFAHGASSVALDSDFSFAGLIDSESVGFNVPEAMTITASGSFVLLDDQTAGGEFSVSSLALEFDGQLTPTGFALTKNFKLADLQAIPPLTPPTLLGDANLDGLVDAADLVFLINEALPDDKPILLPQNFANADMDGDIDVDQDDFDQILELILGVTSNL